MERALSERSNTYRLVSEAGDRYLRVDSESSASALWRPVELELTPDSVISWRWRIAGSLDHIEDERRRRSDDYAARVAVMLDGEPFDRSTPFLMYVWAGSEPVGNVYPSPYTDKAATIVLRSGDEMSGQWLTEERNVADDFEGYFGRLPRRVTAVALMVDTDNTDSNATAWFDDFQIYGESTR